MKKLLLTAFAITTLTIVTNAQASDNTAPTKEQKTQMKAKKEQELNDALKELALTDEQVAQVKDIIADASKKSSELKKDDSISEADKAAKKDAINTEKNDKIKQIIGADKYKQWNAIRKRQKEQSATPSGN